MLRFLTGCVAVEGDKERSGEADCNSPAESFRLCRMGGGLGLLSFPTDAGFSARRVAEAVRFRSPRRVSTFSMGESSSFLW